MIVRMARVRIAGPRARLDETLDVLQDLGVLHVDRPSLPRSVPDASERRVRRHVERALGDVETAFARLPVPVPAASPERRSSPHPIPRPATPAGGARDPTPSEVRRARRIRRRAEALAAARAAQDDERSLLLRYREFFQAFESLLGHELTWPDGQAFYVVLRRGSGGAVADLRQSLDAALSGEVELLDRALSTGETAVLILASAGAAPRVSSLLSAARVDELPAPAGLGESNLLRALPAIRTRLDAIAREQRALDAERDAMARADLPWLSDLRLRLRDRLAQLDARACAWAAEHLFILEGWLPSPRVADLESRLRDALGPEVVVSALRVEDWGDERAPVALRNPPLFQPFEVLTRTLPLPRYGTIDPTPFVAIFFPALFGLMLGDVGYGLVLAAIAGVLRLRSAPGTPLRAVSMVALACASAAIVFGVVFGELFGTLGPRVGLRPFVDREHAAIPFLGFAVALGAVHILLGLVLAVLGAWRRGHRREAFGRGVAFAMLVLTALLLLAVVEVLPARLFTPLVVALLAAFIALVVLEGVAAVVELLSTFGHILSYARIMAIGTASLMLAIVANEMVGALGSVLVGAVFALLFHLVNFAIGIFSPTIHALRLHYVEFFGQFFSPGGLAYRPFGHWRPAS